MKRKSDSAPYIGITIRDRISQRKSAHRRDERFINDDFTFKILEESTNRKYIESREEYWVNKFDSFSNGLNKTYSGKGNHHNSDNFTTLNFIFSEESRIKMSKSAKERCIRDKEKMKKRSKDLWKDADYRSKQEGKRKGRRLSPPKITDNQVKDIRKLWENFDKTAQSTNKIGRKKASHNIFADSICDLYGVSRNTIANIVLNKCRI